MRNIRYLALLLFALLTATACSDDDNGSGNNNKKGIRNTVVMYVSAENSLGYQKFHKRLYRNNGRKSVPEFTRPDDNVRR